MMAQTITPARGPMQAEPIWHVEPSGLRRSEGYRLRDMTQIEVINAQARLRHTTRHAKLAPEDRPVFVQPFTQGQVYTARAYRDLVEWREGSAMRGTDLLGSRGGNGGGSGLFIDSYIEKGKQLELMQSRIGDVVVMNIHRNKDRGNARKVITAQAVVDAVVLGGRELSVVLVRHGWAASTLHLKALRLGLGAALDRMVGPSSTGIQAWQDADVQCQQKGY